MSLKGRVLSAVKPHNRIIPYLISGRVAGPGVHGSDEILLPGPGPHLGTEGRSSVFIPHVSPLL